jgi:hypothetical protein
MESGGKGRPHFKESQTDHPEYHRIHHTFPHYPKSCDEIVVISKSWG